MRSPVGKGIVIVLALATFLPHPASAELFIMIYFGKQLTGNGNLHLKKGNTDLELSDVRWKDQSFKAPIFYGVRAGYWLDRAREWGAAVDFTHAKTILQEKDVVPVRGSRNGSPVEGREPISASIRHFELTHGLNMLTFNGLHRWFPVGRDDRTASGSLQFYTGLGAGFSIPHVEADIEGEYTGRYQTAAGPVANGMVGFNYDFVRALSGILEYKLSYSDVHAALKGGGEIEAATFNHQFISGLGGSVTP